MKRPCIDHRKCPFKDEEDQLLFVSTMHDKSYEFRRCAHCGIIYHDPELTEKELKDHYNNYGQYANPNYFKSEMLKRKENCLDIAKMLSYYFDFDLKKPKTLDVGCSSGILLKYFNDFGYDCYGVEVDPKSSKIAKDIFDGDRIFNGYLSKSPFLDGNFDLVISLSTIEHVPNPFEILLQVNKALKINGILFLATPNFNGPSFKLLKDRWKNTLPGDHISMFTKSSLEHYLKEAGFTIQKTVVAGFNYNLQRNSSGEYKRFSNRYILFFIRAIGFLLRKFNCGDNMQIIAIKRNEIETY